MSTIRAELLAEEIAGQLQGTTDGHCARVDFLERMEAMAICQYLAKKHAGKDISFHLLTTRDAAIQKDAIFITTDEAIEIRNRKQGRLCLFIPSDLVDAAYSSLANSFAFIDGRKLHEAVLKRILKQLPDEVHKVLRIVSRGTLLASYDQRLDFAIAALELAQAKDFSRLGLEMWRVGLIVDASPDFVANLESNRRCTLDLAHPSRISAMARERIQSLKVDKETATALGLFFRGRSMNDVPAWSRELTHQEALTFDRWKFPHLDRSDIRFVMVQPFVNARGVVEKYCKLDQLDDAYGSLRAACGPKRSMAVKWACDPAQPANLSSWSIRIVPSDAEDELDEDNDFIEPKVPRVPGHRRSMTIKLDIEEEEIPTCPVRVRVAPLDAAGNEIIDEEAEKPIFGLSTEFFLVKDISEPLSAQSRESRSTIPTIAYGQLEIAMNTREAAMEEARTQWIEKDISYFSLSFPGRGTLNIGLSNPLLELEKRIRDEPHNGGCYTLSVDEVQPVQADACVSQTLQTSLQEPWSSFWKTRDTFFSRLKKALPRDLVETADWTPELAGAALRYAQSYRDLLDTLVTNRCERAEILDALSVDTLLVQVAGKGNRQEEALVILPTHPFRVAWYANYSQLLRDWEAQLFRYPMRTRKRAIDMQVLRLLDPVNVPAFAHHLGSTEAFTFFQNLRFFHGIALPAGVTDPQRRFNELAVILGLDHDRATMGDIQPDQLKEHFVRFKDLHHYVNTLVTTLVNPDRGTFFAEALQHLLLKTTSTEEEAEEHPISSFQITAYLQDEHKRPLKALDDVRRQIEQQYAQASDYFLPSISTIVRPLSQLEQREPPEAHMMPSR